MADEIPDMQRELSDAVLTLHDARVPLVKDGRRLTLAERIRDLIDAGRYAGNAARIEKETSDRAFASLKEIGTHTGHIAGETTLAESARRLAGHARILEETLNEALNRHWHLVNRRTPVTDGEHAASNEWIRRSSLVLDRNRSPAGTPIGLAGAGEIPVYVRCAGPGPSGCGWRGTAPDVKRIDGRVMCPKCGSGHLEFSGRMPPKGDGVTDDTAAIQAAVDLAHNRVRCMAAGAGGRPCRWEGPISAVKGFGGDGRPECPRCGQDQLVEVLPSDFAKRQAVATGTAEVVCYACSTRVALVWPQIRPGWDEAAKAGRALLTTSSSFADLLQSPTVRTALAGVTIGEVFRGAAVAHHLTKDLPAPSGGDKAEDREIPPADLFGRGISMLRRLADETSDLGAAQMADQLDDLRSRLWPEEVDDDAER